jgi:hypothetical protein
LANINLANDEKDIAPIDWARGLGSGLLAGAAFVAAAMLVEKNAINAGKRLFKK